jgi:hypothetical protein
LDWAGVGAGEGAGVGAWTGWDFFVFFFFGVGESIEARTRPVETGWGSWGVVVVGVVVGVGSCGAGGLGECGFGLGFVGARSGLGVGCDFGWLAGCGRDTATGGDGCGVTDRVTKFAALGLEKEGWCAGLTAWALATCTVWTCLAGRVLTCEDGAGFLAGRSTLVAPVDCPPEEPLGGAAGAGAGDPELGAVGGGAGAAPVATEAGCDGCRTGFAAR